MSPIPPHGPETLFYWLPGLVAAGWLILALGLLWAGLAVRRRVEDRTSHRHAALFTGILGAQYALGITTLLLLVPVALGVLHLYDRPRIVCRPDGEVVAPGDMYGQTRYCLQAIREAIEALGGRIDHVVRTRVYLTDVTRWEEAGRAHGEMFGEIQPASAFLGVSELLTPGLLVEIEATAVVA